MRYPEALPPGAKLGGYEIVEVLGQGGFGLTYRGFNRITRRQVAVKEFFPRGTARRLADGAVAFDEERRSEVDWAIRKFEESTTIMAGLSHPNIVRVLDFVHANNTGYQFMDLVEGQSLQAMLTARGTAKLEDLEPIFAGIIDALAYVHAQSIVHRDIAPDNIMIRSDGVPILIDFGGLKYLGDAVTAIVSQPARDTTFLVAKRYYSAPELSAQGSDIGTTADVYSLGAMLYFALMGRPPADALQRTHALISRRPDPCAALLELPTEVLLDGKTPSGTPIAPRASLDLIMRSLSLEPEDRPQAVTELLAIWSAPRPAEPPPPPPRPLWPKVAAGLALAVVIVLAAIWGWPLAADLWAERQETALLADAGHVEAKLRDLQARARTPAVTAEVRRRLETVAEERRGFEAARNDRAALAAFLSKPCVACIVKPAAEARLAEIDRTASDRDREETAALERAGFDEASLRALDGLARNPGTRAEVRRRLDAVAAEARGFEAARNDRAALAAFLARPCVACLVRPQAEARLQDLDRVATDAERQRDRDEAAALDRAGYDEGQLRSLADAARNGSTRAEARRRLDVTAAERRDFEAVRDDADRLRQLLARPCIACSSRPAAEARLRDLQDRQDRSDAVALDRAKFDEFALRGVMETSGNAGVRAEARRRLDLIATERRDFEAARDDPDRLRALLARPCVACTSQAAAQARLADLDGRQDQAEAGQLDRAGFDEQALRPLADTARGARVRGEALRRLDVLAAERRDFEAAGNDRARLQAFVAQTCEACVSRTRAFDRLRSLPPDTPPAQTGAPTCVVGGFTSIEDRWLALRTTPFADVTLRNVIPPRILEGATLKALERSSDWYRVELPTGETGWASARFIRCPREPGAAAGPTAGRPAAAATYQYVTGFSPTTPLEERWLALRTEPFADPTLRNVIDRLLENTKVSIVENRGDWARVDVLGGKSGWVATRYLRCCRTASQ